MMTAKNVENLVAGDWLPEVGFVESVNVYRDVQANKAAAKQKRDKFLKGLDYAKQVSFEQEVQYRPIHTGRVVVSIRGNQIRTYNIGDIVTVWQKQAA